MSLTDISERILENVPALGRDFQEGALYDARNEKIVIGCGSLHSIYYHIISLKMP